MMSAASKKLFSHIGICLVFLLGLAACRRDDNPAPGGSTSADPVAAVSFQLDTLTNVYVKRDSMRWFGNDSVHGFKMESGAYKLASVAKYGYAGGLQTKYEVFLIENGQRRKNLQIDFGYTDGIMTYYATSTAPFTTTTWSCINLDNTLRRGRMTWSDTASTRPLPQIHFQFRPDRQLSYRVEYRNGATVPDTAVKITYDAQGLPKTCFVDYVGLGYPKQFYELVFSDLEVRRLLSKNNPMMSNPFIGQHPLGTANKVKGYDNNVLTYESNYRRVIIDAHRISLVKEEMAHNRPQRIRRDSVVFYF